MDQSSIQKQLVEHLNWWGLRRFDSDAAYFQWQRETLGKDILADLHRLVLAKQAPAAPPAAETAFYDRSADPRVLPVLYSQRYDYYLALAPLLVGAIQQGAPPRRVLDCGCGVGVLTTFLARQFPTAHFVGVDRSAASLAVGRDKAKALGLGNVSFEQVDLDQTPVAGSYDLVLATQTLLQSEQEPGLASRSWDTFERLADAAAQAGFEARTGLGIKLDHLRQAVTSDARLLFFEKARQLARRVPVQRALSARGWHLQAAPLPLRYRIVEEISDDGPFYLLGRTANPAYPWSEEPEEEASPGELPRVDQLASGTWPVSASADPDHAPLYENHSPSAQAVWQGLPGRTVTKEKTWKDPRAGLMHVELGQVGKVAYLYQANTFDQRQLVLVERARLQLLLDYWQELTAEE